MAGDWIKIEHWTPDKPEVFRIAEMLSIDPDAVTGKLIRIWIWADQQTIDGNATSVTKTLLDRLCSVTGFADALISAGWLLQDQQGLRFTNFDRHNGETAKLRALNAKRQAKHKASNRDRKVGNAKGNAEVTPDSQIGNDAGVISALPKEEKRREEKIEAAKAATPAGAGMVLFSDLEDLPSEEKKETTGARNSADVIAVFDAYRKHHPRAFAKPVPTSKEWRAIAARLREGFTVADLVEAIEGCHVSPFHCGENDRQTPYQSLSLIVRDGSQVNNFIELARKGPTPVLSEKNQRGQRAMQSYLARFRVEEGGQDDGMVN